MRPDLAAAVAVMAIAPLQASADNLHPASRDALIFAPFDSSPLIPALGRFSSNLGRVRDQLISQGFSVTVALNQDANLAIVRRFAEFGIVLIYSHGGLGESGDYGFLTGQLAGDEERQLASAHPDFFSVDGCFLWPACVGADADTSYCGNSRKRRCCRAFCSSRATLRLSGVNRTSRI